MIPTLKANYLAILMQVKWWLDGVDKLEVKVRFIKADYEARLRLPVDQAASIRFTYLLSKKADMTMEEVRNLKERTFAEVADELVLVICGSLGYQ